MQEFVFVIDLVKLIQFELIDITINKFREIL